MSIEAALVIWKDGTSVLHEPDGRSSVRIPDTQSLWDLLFENRDRLEGVAHTHPGNGYPQPSHEDLTTFAAVEKGLGIRTNWWILSRDSSVLVRWSDRLSAYEAVQFMHPEEDEPWADGLRRASYLELRRPEE